MLLLILSYLFKGTIRGAYSWQKHLKEIVTYVFFINLYSAKMSDFWELKTFREKTYSFREAEWNRQIDLNRERNFGLCSQASQDKLLSGVVIKCLKVLLRFSEPLLLILGKLLCLFFFKTKNSLNQNEKTAPNFCEVFEANRQSFF